MIEGRFLPNERRDEGPFGEFMGYYVPVDKNAVFEGLGVTCQPFVLHSVVKIRQQYEGHARQVRLAVMGTEPTWAKMVTVVDEDVDIYNMDDVMWAILTRSRPDKDFITIPDTPTFYRDPNKDHWGRMGIDATAPFVRRDEFVRKRIPGAATVDRSQYVEPKRN